MTRRLRISVDWDPRPRPRWLRALGRDVILLLPEGTYEVRVLRKVPRMSERALREHVSAHADRYFPRTPGGSVTGALWEDVGAWPAARAYAIPRLWAEDLLQRADDAGLWVVNLCPDRSPGVSLYPRAAREARVRRLWRWGADLSLVLLVYAVAASYLARDRSAPLPMPAPRQIAVAQEARDQARSSMARISQARSDIRSSDLVAQALADLLESLEGPEHLASVVATDVGVVEAVVTTSDVDSTLKVLGGRRGTSELRLEGTPVLDDPVNPDGVRVTLKRRGRV